MHFTVENPIPPKNGFWLCDAVASQPVGVGPKNFTGRYLYKFPTEWYRSRGKAQLCDNSYKFRRFAPSKVRKSGENVAHPNGQKKDRPVGLCDLFFGIMLSFSYFYLDYFCGIVKTDHDAERELIVLTYRFYKIHIIVQQKIQDAYTFILPPCLTFYRMVKADHDAEQEPIVLTFHVYIIHGWVHKNIQGAFNFLSCCL